MDEEIILTLHPEDGKQGVTTVKPGLEACGELERFPGRGEQKIRLKR